MLSEVSERQAPHAAAVLAASGLVPRTAASADFRATVVIGTRPEQAGHQPETG